MAVRESARRAGGQSYRLSSVIDDEGWCRWPCSDFESKSAGHGCQLLQADLIENTGKKKVEVAVVVELCVV